MPEKRFNRYEINGDICTGYTTSGRPFFLDADDYETIKDYCWCFDSYGYLVARSGGKMIKLHRLILPGHQIIDHANGNKSDNRKANLRACTPKQNARNRGPWTKREGGTVGVYKFRKSGKWYASISMNGQRIFLGQFDDFESAQKVRADAERKCFGAFSRANAGHDTGSRTYAGKVLTAAERWAEEFIK